MEIPIGILAAAGGKATSYESIATVSGTGSSGIITFTSIPSTFQHLEIRVLSKLTAASDSNDLYAITFNGDSGANYAHHRLLGSGSAASAGGAANATSMNFAAFLPCSGANLSNTHGVAIHTIHDYASTTKFKTLKNFWGSDLNTVGGDIGLTSGLWRSTSAITSITLTSAGNNFTSTSRFALYGIKG